tara:strand:+ start:2488 stop:3531 length:1044 start_codon:yes stop_codon:yes gene_type:complete
LTEKDEDHLVVFPSGSLNVTEEIFYNKMNKLEFEVPMVYNEQVAKFIDFFAINWQPRLKEVLSLSEHYFPIYDKIFDQYDIPYEIKYLSIIESALNPKAVSRSGAVGLWQFMPATGKLYGLKNTYEIDERSSIEKSTEAAAKYLKESYKRFGDWHLALASYNAGPGGIARAMRRSGGENFWEIQPFLYKETQDYIPKYIAMAYIMNTYKEYGITAKTSDIDLHNLTTVALGDIYFLDDLAKVLEVKVSTIKSWNPELKSDRLPSKSYALRLPEDYSYKILERKNVLMDLNKISTVARVPKYYFHTVKKGECLPLIAKRYKITVGQLKTWNSLHSSLIFPNQKLKIYK